MVEIFPTKIRKTDSNRSDNTLFYQDITNGFNAAGILVDSDVYDNGTFIDRDYDIRQIPQLSVLLENLGPDSLTYEILSTTKNFVVMNDDISDTDFSEVEKASTAIAPGSSATGSVEVTGGPSTAAEGTLTLASAVANTFATGTVTCASVLANAFATGTVTCAAVEADDTVTINGLIYTAVSGAKNDDTEFSIDTGNNECAADLADSINNDVREGTLGVVSAAVVDNIVTCTTDVAGTDGNATTLVSSNGTRLAVSGAGTFSGGVNADTVTINGLLYTAVEGIKADDTQFSVDTSDDACATDLADSITNDVRVGTLGVVTADATTNVVTCTSDEIGTDGNAVTLVSSDGATLAVSGAGTFTGGVDADIATVNGLTYTAVAGTKANNTQFSIDTSDTAAATDLAASITNDTRPPITVPTISVTATSNAGVVTVTAPLNDGADGNAIDISGTANITASAATLENGVTSTMNSIDVGGLELLLAPIRWRTSDTLTGEDIRDAINANVTNPNYSATAAAGVVTITLVPKGPSTAVVTSTTTVMTKTDVNFTGGAKGVSDVLNILNTSPQRTALRIRCKTTSDGDEGTVRGDVKFKTTKV